jgi:Predicted xylanase/chitin deacetylase
MSFTALMYHEIRKSSMHQPGQASPIKIRQDYEDNLPPPLFVTLENFLAQMEYLHENGFHTLSLSEVKNYYFEGAELPDKSVLLTFDDCYQSSALYAYPALKKYAFHAAAFVVTGWLNGEKKPFDPDSSVCLTAKDLEEMRDVFEYANHTDQFHTRTDAGTSMMMDADDQKFSEDLDRCNENPLIQARDVFAYPFGIYSDRNIALLRRKGFRLAFTSEGGRNDKDTDPLKLKRNVVPYFMDLDAFRTVIG